MLVNNAGEIIFSMLSFNGELDTFLKSTILCIWQGPKYAYVAT